MDPGPYRCRNCDAPLFESPEPIRASPVSDILGTNAVPLPSKVPGIHAIIREIEDIIRELAGVLQCAETEYARLRAVVNRLTRDRIELERLLKGHRDLLTPARGLPPEVLSMIFIHCLPEDVELRPNVDRAPLLLGSVCRRWRSIALSTPELWSSISVEVTEGSLPQIQNWIPRSGGLPTSMALREPGFRGRTRGDVEAFLEAISWSPPRLRELSVRSRDYVDEVSALQPTPFPDLQKLVLRFYTTASTSQVVVFQNSPQLQEVGLELLIPLSRVVLPWHLLTRVHADLAHMEEFIHVLRQSPNLQEYSTSDDKSFPRTDCDEDVTHPHLTHLRITAEGPPTL
ncbi:hypothetical protein PLICRDRAFT_457917 [Plicaturopsis crispa FD-325 SS-3]|nr:hypothetical protein PLICRDRAFT_457917 [Plicaturopsis crispa FD-325 SS-3]